MSLPPYDFLLQAVRFRNVLMFSPSATRTARVAPRSHLPSAQSGGRDRWLGGPFVFPAMGRHITPSLREQIIARDKCCQRCGKGPPDVVLHIDHIIPFSRGGSNDADNLRALCAPCNMSKGAKPPRDREVGERYRTAPRDGLVGLWVQKRTTDHETGLRILDRQGRIERIADGIALLRLFDLLFGEPMDALFPVPLSDLSGGEWVLFDNHSAFIKAGDRLNERYFDAVRRKESA